MPNAARKTTPNKGYIVYDKNLISPNDKMGEIIADLIDDTDSNMTKIDSDVGKALEKPAYAYENDIGVFDAKKNIIDGGANIAKTFSERDVLVGKAVINYVLESQNNYINYQGDYEYFGTLAQLGSVTPKKGTAIIYEGNKTNVTAVYKGTYSNGTNTWTYDAGNPLDMNNGTWFMIEHLLGTGGESFGMAILNIDGTNTAEFVCVEFPDSKIDGDDIEYDGNGDLTLKPKGTAGSYGELANKPLPFGGTFKALQKTIDSKGRTIAVVEKTMTLPGADNINDGKVTVNQGELTISEFTVNQSGNISIDIPDPKFLPTTDFTGEALENLTKGQQVMATTDGISSASFVDIINAAKNDLNFKGMGFAKENAIMGENTTVNLVFI